MSRVLRLLLAIFFLATGAAKVLGLPEAVETFPRAGVGPWLRMAAGLLEIAGAAGLLSAPLAAAAAIGLGTLMVGAILSHLLLPGASPAPAGLALVGCVVVAWLEHESLRMIAVLRSGKGPMDGWTARAYDRGVQVAFRETFAAVAADVLNDVRGVARLLDAGCGPGQFTILAAERLPDAEVWGVDLAPTMIEIARRHAAESPAAARLHFEVADVTRLPFPDGHFDAVMSSGSIKHWSDPVAGLAELHRVLAAGGRAFVGELNRVAPPQAVAANRARLRHWFFRWIYPRFLEKALSPEEAREVFSRSPFGPPSSERMLLDGCFWLFEARKPGH